MTDKHIEQFQAIFEKNFHRKISRKDALDRATRLVNLVRAVYRPENWEEETESKS